MPNYRRDEDPAVIPSQQRFQYSQKISQAFLIFKNNQVGRLEKGDIFTAYCHVQASSRKPYVIGAATYKGGIHTTVPVMGAERAPYDDSIYPIPEEEDGLVYCAQGEQIYVNVYRPNGINLDLNSRFLIPSFVNGFVQILLPLNEEVPDSSPDCNCRTFNCGQCDSPFQSIDVTPEMLNSCCDICCSGSDDEFIYQCPEGYECPDGTSSQCPLNYTCVNREGTYCCIPDDGGPIE